MKLLLLLFGIPSVASADITEPTGTLPDIAVMWIVGLFILLIVVSKFYKK